MLCILSYLCLLFILFCLVCLFMFLSLFLVIHLFFFSVWLLCFLLHRLCSLKLAFGYELLVHLEMYSETTGDPTEYFPEKRWTEDAVVWEHKSPSLLVG